MDRAEFFFQPGFVICHGCLIQRRRIYATMISEAKVVCLHRGWSACERERRTHPRHSWHSRGTRCCLRRAEGGVASTTLIGRSWLRSNRPWRFRLGLRGACFAATSPRSYDDVNVATTPDAELAGMM